ncbi:Bro-N domain-containing protein [Candidatus Saccharibacteria bacterium]|nr:Bro-N domain-containing protein [Candidatus Saccharibacteria bacterium]
MTKQLVSDKNNLAGSNVALFQEKEIRKVWNDKEGKWYFSVEDVVFALTNSRDPKQYINKMRKRDEFLSAGWVQIVHTLAIPTAGGLQKMNCADTEGILRIIQSIPSKQAEPFKRWLARVGRERIDEINNPELAGKRMHDLYLRKGYSEEWVEQRERGIVSRNALTDEWRNRGAREGRDYAILTNEIYRTGFGLTAREYKEFKGIEKHDNLRDSMTEMELALTNLGEVTAKELHKKNDSYGVPELKKDATDAGEVVGLARGEAEKRLGESVVSKKNYKGLRGFDEVNKIEGGRRELDEG